MKWVVGTSLGNILYKNFFECSGAIPFTNGTILKETSCYVDAITMLILKLERKFVHLHPMLQKIFLGLPSIRNP